MKLTMLCEKPWSAIATSDFFFDDGNDTPVAHLNRNGVLFFDNEAGRLADKKRDARLQRTTPTVGIEKAFERLICNQLQKAGIEFEAQKRSYYGIIDIFISGDPPSIIELKADRLQSSIRQAIGQLAFYASEFPGAITYIAVPGGLDSETKKIINHWGIREWR